MFEGQVFESWTGASVFKDMILFLTFSSGLMSSQQGNGQGFYWWVPCGKLGLIGPA